MTVAINPKRVAEPLSGHSLSLTIKANPIRSKKLSISKRNRDDPK
jgi:hypothetical protein